MKDLIITETDFSPRINFKYSENQLSLEGRSLPEDVRGFYGPVFDWLEEFVNTTEGPVKLLFKLEYFNTASAKVVVDMLFKLNELIKRDIPVEVKWFYDEYDEDMYEVGLRFSEITEMEIEIIRNHE